MEVKQVFSDLPVSWAGLGYFRLLFGERVASGGVLVRVVTEVLDPIWEHEMWFRLVRDADEVSAP